MNETTVGARVTNTLLGTLVFTVVVVGCTLYLQSSLILVKKYDTYTHWTVVLLAVPVVAGLLLRLMRYRYPLICTVAGSLASAGILYPQYRSFWAVPPTMVDMAMYVAIIMGIAYVASQPLKTTFMMAFRMGKYSVTTFTVGNAKRPAKASAMTKSQRLQATGHSNSIAMLELLVGLTSLALSIFSIFFLGRA